MAIDYGTMTGASTTYTLVQIDGQWRIRMMADMGHRKAKNCALSASYMF